MRGGKTSFSCPSRPFWIFLKNTNFISDWKKRCFTKKSSKKLLIYCWNNFTKWGTMFMKGLFFSAVNFYIFVYASQRRKRNVILQPLKASFDSYWKIQSFISDWRQGDMAKNFMKQTFSLFAETFYQNGGLNIQGWQFFFS